METKSTSSITGGIFYSEQELINVVENNYFRSVDFHYNYSMLRWFTHRDLFIEIY